MKFLILPKYEGLQLNHSKAIERGAKWENAEYWSYEQTETEVALRITDIEELDEEYHAQLIDELPERFIRFIEI